jgi:hypothetical protein
LNDKESVPVFMEKPLKAQLNACVVSLLNSAAETSSSYLHHNSFMFNAFRELYKLVKIR